MKRLPFHLQGKATMPLLGGCFSKGHRLALISLLPTLEARPGERDDGERARLMLYQQSLLQAGQPPRFVLHEPSLHKFALYFKNSPSGHLTDAGVKAAGDLLDKHAFVQAISAVLGAGDE